MKVGKFRAILSQVDQKVKLDPGARLTFEISGPDAAMQVFDVGAVAADEETATIHLNARAAICKPRHREERQTASSCCAPPEALGGVKCCA